MAITSLKLMQFLEEVAKICFDKYGDDFYGALNAAECIVNNLERSPGEWAGRVHAILEGEL